MSEPPFGSRALHCPGENRCIFLASALHLVRGHLGNFDFVPMKTRSTKGTPVPLTSEQNWMLYLLLAPDRSVMAKQTRPQLVQVLSPQGTFYPLTEGQRQHLERVLMSYGPGTTAPITSMADEFVHRLFQAFCPTESMPASRSPCYLFAGVARALLRMVNLIRAKLGLDAFQMINVPRKIHEVFPSLSMRPMPGQTVDAHGRVMWAAEGGHATPVDEEEEEDAVTQEPLCILSAPPASTRVASPPYAAGDGKDPDSTLPTRRTDCDPATFPAREPSPDTHTWLKSVDAKNKLVAALKQSFLAPMPLPVMGLHRTHPPYQGDDEPPTTAARTLPIPQLVHNAKLVQATTDSRSAPPRTSIAYQAAHMPGPKFDKSWPGFSDTSDEDDKDTTTTEDPVSPDDTMSEPSESSSEPINTEDDADESVGASEEYDLLMEAALILEHNPPPDAYDIVASPNASATCRSPLCVCGTPPDFYERCVSPPLTRAPSVEPSAIPDVVMPDRSATHATPDDESDEELVELEVAAGVQANAVDALFKRVDQAAELMRDRRVLPYYLDRATYETGATIDDNIEVHIRHEEEEAMEMALRRAEAEEMARRRVDANDASTRITTRVTHDIDLSDRLCQEAQERRTVATTTRLTARENVLTRLRSATPEDKDEEAIKKVTTPPRPRKDDTIVHLDSSKGLVGTLRRGDSDPSCSVDSTLRAARTQTIKTYRTDVTQTIKAHRKVALEMVRLAQDEQTIRTITPPPMLAADLPPQLAPKSRVPPPSSPEQHDDDDDSVEDYDDEPRDAPKLPSGKASRGRGRAGGSEADDDDVDLINAQPLPVRRRIEIDLASPESHAEKEEAGSDRDEEPPASSPVTCRLFIGPPNGLVVCRGDDDPAAYDACSALPVYFGDDVLLLEDDGESRIPLLERDPVDDGDSEDVDDLYAPMMLNPVGGKRMSCFLRVTEEYDGRLLMRHKRRVKVTLKRRKTGA